MGADRDVMVEGFRRVLTSESLTVFDELVPTVRWRDVLPEEFLLSSAACEAYDDAGRRTLHAALREVVGPAAADATMEYLPPVPWKTLREQGLDSLLWDYPSPW